MQKLNLPLAKLRVKQIGDKRYVFDAIRRKYLVLTPEEWVRQHYVHYLINEKQVPSGLIALEKGLKVNSMSRRTDIVIYSQDAMPLVIVECKAASVPITQKVFEQIARYNMSLQVPFLVVTNGVQTYSCLLDYQNQNYHFLPDLPVYRQMHNLAYSPKA